ncbi:MAG: hypothetical protein IKO26_06870 [Paludibacteraceae bacterium]|jgi:hypothetical protein|nr:hypothetical protein [Paludibacteraceae bacterium]
MAKTYFQPEVTVALIALQSNLLAGSAAPAPTGDQMGLSSTITDEQW